MKKFILFTMLLLMTMQAHGTFTAQDYIDGKTYLGSGNRLLDPLYLHIVDAQGADTVGKPFFFYIPGTAPAEIEGYLYYNANLDALRLWTGAAWETLEAGGNFASLDEAYIGGPAIEADSGAVAITVAQSSGNEGLTVAQNDAANNSNGIAVTMAASNTGAGYYVDGTTGTIDLLGDNFSMANTGILTQVGAIIGSSDLVLENGEIIDNGTDDMILFNTGAEDLLIDFTTGTNTITFTANSTGATVFDFGDFVTLKDMSAITGLAEDFTISTTGDSTGEDLIISQAGTGDNQVIIQSAGTATNAIALTASVAGITATALDDITIQVTSSTGGEDILITQVGGNNSSITLTAAGTGTDAIGLVATAGGVAISSGGAGKDCVVDATAGVILIDSGQAAADDAIVIVTTGAASGIQITSLADIDITTTGTGGEDITLDNQGGSIHLISTEAVTDGFNLDTTGGVDIDATLSFSVRSAEATGDAIELVTTNAAGGIDITSGTGDVVITSTDDIVLTNATAVGDMIQLLNTAGTSVTEDSAAIQITSTAGGIIIQSDAALNSDNVVLRVDGGATADILIHNDAGTGADCINLLSDEGGITLTANGAGAGDILIDAEDDIQLTATGKVTITNSEPVTVSGTFTPVTVNMLHFLVTDQATVTLTAAQSGKILLIRAMSQATTMNLPAEAPGLHFEFWYVGGATATDDHIIDAEANANYFIGGLQFFDSDDNTMTEVYSDASDDAKLTLHNMEAGTRLKITCDGTNWYITGTVYSNTAPVFVNPV